MRTTTGLLNPSRRQRLRALVVGVIVLSGLTVAPTAQASKVGPASPGRSMSLPAGYSVVSKAIALPAKSLRYGIARCSGALTILGGGVLVLSPSLAAHVIDSRPIPNGDVAGQWDAYVANGSSADSSFIVYAICGSQPKNYSLGENDWTAVAPHSYLGDRVGLCPAGKPLSGGPASDEAKIGLAINSSFPEGTGWRVDLVNNAATTAYDFTSAVCGTLSSYHVVRTSASNPAGRQSTARALCGTGVPVGGGAYSSSPGLTVTVNSSYPVSGGWAAYVNNGGTSDATLSAYAICAT